MDYVTAVASNMHLCLPHHCLCSEYLYEEWDPKLVRGCGDTVEGVWGRCGGGVKEVWRMCVCVTASLSLTHTHTLAHENVINSQVSELFGYMRADGDSSYRVDLLTKSFEKVRRQMEALAASSGQALREEKEPWFQLEAVAVEVPER